MEFLILISGIAFVPIIHYYTKPVTPSVPGFTQAKPLPSLIKSSSADEILTPRSRLKDFKHHSKSLNKKQTILLIFLASLGLLLAFLLKSPSIAGFQIYK